jgi:hypothetical protein
VRWLIAATLLATACASTAPPGPTQPPGPPGPPELPGLEKAYVDLRRFDSQLQHVDTQAAAPDCVQITQLRDSICSLAARICQIAERDTTPTIATERCYDGKTRCTKAVERAEARGCSKK